MVLLIVPFPYVDRSIDYRLVVGGKGGAFRGFRLEVIGGSGR
jgi:hypothetical protein